jgi:preprotein translocase subunit SecD
LEFNDEGKTLFAEITKRNVGKPVAIYLDNSPISVPRVNEPITDGRAVISGNFSIQDAKLLAQRLNAGALPVPVQLVSQQTVGATLGGESLKQSLFAGMIGLIAVAFFMILFYRLPGLFAVVALLIYGVIVLFLFKYIPVTLTLSGIAGFLLSIGMAVDANVLIFERMKEEVRDGKPLDLSIQEGFKRAWSSIRDGNLSTLITCFILAWFGTSMIRGFAITLSVGILVSMFSAIVITRQFLKVFVTPKNQGKLKVLWLFGVKKRS